MRTVAAFFFIAAAALAQTGQPNLLNARLETRAFSGDLGAQIRAANPTWFGYAVKATPGEHRNCCSNGEAECGCSLEGRSDVVIDSRSSNRPVQLEESDAIEVLFRVANNAVEKVRVFSLSCWLDAGGLPFVWLTGVPAPTSLAYLEKLVEVNDSRRLMEGALFAISQHGGAQALEALIRLAKTDASPHVRSQALFWLAQRAGERAASTITDAIENDPDTSVKNRAVFALSQLPNGEGVPKLIQVASTQRNREVRKQAFFWLGQSKDPRALEYIQGVLMK